MARARNDAAAYASNWRTVLAVDAALGVVLAAFGVLAAVLVDPVAGVVLAAVGVGYLAAIGARARRWSRLRRARSS
jgi:hypothetical protein